MCFSPEQAELLDKGNILVMFVFDGGTEGVWAVEGGFLTPAGLLDNDVAFNMLGTTVAQVRQAVTEHMSERMDATMREMANDTSPPDEPTLISEPIDFEGELAAGEAELERIGWEPNPEKLAETKKR